MLGLFDSGSGGLNTVRYVKRTADDVDLLYLIDRENAPYGVKSENELIKIIERNIEILTDMGSERVLIACCTASTLHHRLGAKYREISIPIIAAVANAAKKVTRSGRIGVIATNRTVESHSFARHLCSHTVSELALPSLVTMIDGGLSDSTVTADDEELLEDMLLPVLTAGADTLILGCTHFPALITTVERIAHRYGIRHVIDSAKAGGDLLIDVSRKLKL